MLIEWPILVADDSKSWMGALEHAIAIPCSECINIYRNLGVFFPLRIPTNVGLSGVRCVIYDLSAMVVIYSC